MKKEFSLRGWFVRYTAVLLAVLVCTLAGMLVYTGVTLRRQIAGANERALAIYAAQFGASLESTERYLSTLPLLNADISTLALTTDETQHYLAVRSLATELKKNALVYDSFDGLFIYSRNPYQDEFIYELGNDASTLQMVELINELRALPDEQLVTNGWQQRQLGGESYAMCVAQNGTTFFGAWVRLEKLLWPFTGLNAEYDSRVLFVDGQGTLLAGGEGLGGGLSAVPLPAELGGETSRQVRLNGTSYLMTVCPVGVSGLVLVELVATGQLYRTVLYTVLVLVVPIALLLAFVLAAGRSLGRRVARPVESLVAAMGGRAPEEGGITEALHTAGVAGTAGGAGGTQAGPIAAAQGSAGTADETGSFTEFNLIARTLNEMLARIQTLQRDVYERTILGQQVQLQYLQLQIRPHFLLNSLNIIYSFAQSQKHQLVQSMTLSLVRYFRYMLGTGRQMAPLRYECEHVRNYLEIQALRFPDTFTWSQQVDERLDDELLPPLAVQSFVENSVKYALDSGEVHSIRLEARPLEGAEPPGPAAPGAAPVPGGGQGFFEILVSDNGPGYPEQVLAAFAGPGGEAAGDGSGSIGIQNVRQRLWLIYGGAARLELTNLPTGGACTRLVLPRGFTEGGGTNGVEHTAGG